MILDDQNPREGRAPAALATLIALVCFVILAGVGLAKCSTPSPTPLVTPHPPKITADSTAQAAAAASQTLKGTLRLKPASQDGLQATSGQGAGGLSLDGSNQAPTSPIEAVEFTFEVSQAVGVAAGASASVSHENGGVSRENHARLGVIAATMPGILAADYQLARVDVPPWLLGVPLELGLDAAVNLEAGAVGVTAGQKAFAGAYYWSRWNLSEQGPAIAVGLRF